ncbi:Uncharacterised protein [Mycobacteroides abscessus subsp. abscessus]|nr:Uncharacterised protein [Mycobacteroides abscessus subsp. abscessus]
MAAGPHGTLYSRTSRPPASSATRRGTVRRSAAAERMRCGRNCATIRALAIGTPLVSASVRAMSSIRDATLSAARSMTSARSSLAASSQRSKP